ncbi:hypothetical protein JDV02_006128 [Purpureocillium takamizusanense]|uniref:Peptidase A2 domain-containing protein n=1 Tax=Purpureocillium takamizusanense TaxID=2060973 RepID=A0A9Q8QHK6_9HYPO|nr:uncharacterized protein JDV02_006128 [Purpureocillium takamizusanense]UNI19988.1 hypothetical protein JDV02_006128 [Purpureocillium takamizusanense]
MPPPAPAMEQLSRGWVHHLRKTARQETAARGCCPLCAAEIQPDLDAFKAHVRADVSRHPALADDADIEEAFKHVTIQNPRLEVAAPSSEATGVGRPARKRPVPSAWAAVNDDGLQRPEDDPVDEDQREGNQRRSKKLCSPPASVAQQRRSSPPTPGRSRARPSVASDFERGLASKNRPTARQLWNPDDDAQQRTSRPRHSQLASSNHAHRTQQTRTRLSTPRIRGSPVEPSSAIEMIRQPETRPISPEQLVAEVKGIYAGLVMIESKCIEYDRSQETMQLSQAQYQAIISLHRSLLHEHHDFFRASQHRTASETLRRLASQYSANKARVNALQHPKTQFEWRVDGCINGTPISALVDTGANCVAISEGRARRLGLTPEPGSAGKPIKLPCGQSRESSGVVQVNFNYADEEGSGVSYSLRCAIMPRLEHDLILPFKFLSDTGTFSPRHKSRLNDVPIGPFGQERVSLRLLDGHTAYGGEEKARLAGFVGGLPCVAVPDTGSTIMAMAASYAAYRGLDIDRTRRIKVRFADGSETTTLGVATASWALREDDDYPINYEWHVLEGLSVNAILSIDYIKEHDIFGGEHEASFVDADTAVDWEHSEIFGICRVAEGSEELGRLADDFFTDINSPDGFTYPQRVKEYARREEIRDAITRLPAAERETAQAAEKERQRYWNHRQRIHILGLNRQLVQHADDEPPPPDAAAVQLSPPGPSDKRPGRRWKVWRRDK